MQGTNKVQRQTMMYSLMRWTACAIVLLAWSFPALAQREGAAATRAELDAWTQAYNARQTDKVCAIFAEDLRYKFGEVADRGYGDVCAALHRLLGDATQRATSPTPARLASDGPRIWILPNCDRLDQVSA